MCILYLSKGNWLISSLSEFDFRYSKAIVADSFSTLPKFPVIPRLPLPFDSEDSIKRISPPTAVHASPVTTPAILLFSARSRLIFTGPRIVLRSSKFGDTL